MGARAEGFLEAVVAVAQRFDPGFDPATVEQRPSRVGNYLGCAGRPAWSKWCESTAMKE
jgi:putative lipoic acid-binding regulatory protein